MNLVSDQISHIKMTAGDTMQHRPSGELIRKLSSEMRPPAICPRDERIRSVNSFEEIIESEEEENQVLSFLRDFWFLWLICFLKFRMDCGLYKNHQRL